MRVFVLCTGRTGSYTFVKACEHIENFSTGHETKSSEIGQKRFHYPENHIEADNRLSWFLGDLDKRYGKNAFYIHLKRDKQKVVKSFLRRFNSHNSIIKAYIKGIKKLPVEKLNHEEKKKLCEDYVDTVNSNITLFLKDKPRKMSINLSEIEKDFYSFWEKIGAEGNINEALETFDYNLNNSGELKHHYLYQLKLKLLSIKNMFLK